MSRDILPPPALPATVFSDSTSVDNRLTMLHGNSRAAVSQNGGPAEFVLSSEGNADFDRKAKDIFASLGALEEKHQVFNKAMVTNKRMRDKAEECMKKEDSPSDRFDKKVIDEANRRNRDSGGFESFRNIHKNVKDMFRNSEGGRDRDGCSASSSSFKVPQAPGRRSIGSRPGGNRPTRRDTRPDKPDFMKNPDKWRRYSLEGVKDVTESSNSAAAFAFLDELKKRKEEQMDDSSSNSQDPLPTKITFKAPSRSAKTEEKGKSKMARRVVVAEEEEGGEEKGEEKEEREKAGGEETKSNEKGKGEKRKLLSLGMDEDVEMEDLEKLKEEDSKEPDQSGSDSIDRSSSGSGSTDLSVVSGSLGSKHVMKEYVVGAEKKEKREKKEKPKIGKEIKLSHLDDEDEED